MPGEIRRVCGFPFAAEMRRKLVGAGGVNQTDEAAQVEMVLAKIFGQGFEQLRMAWLDGPGGRWRMDGIQPRQIEIERRVHNSHAHQLGPNQVDRRSSKLRIFCEHARVSFAPWLTITGYFTGQQELRRDIRIV